MSSREQRREKAAARDGVYFYVNVVKVGAERFGEFGETSLDDVPEILAALRLPIVLVEGQLDEATALPFLL